MIRNLFFFLFLITKSSFAQEVITRDNYYSHFKDAEDYKKLNVKHLGTGHLSDAEIGKILYQEMKKAGFEWIDYYRIIQIDADNYIVSICYSEKQNFGFILESSFDLIPEKETQNFKSLTRKDHGYDYGEKIILQNGKSRFVKIDNVPDNLFIIKLDLYWYQSTENEEINKTLVSKEIITEIFKQDVREVLSKVKK